MHLMRHWMAAPTQPGAPDIDKSRKQATENTYGVRHGFSFSFMRKGVQLFITTAPGRTCTHAVAPS